MQQIQDDVIALTAEGRDVGSPGHGAAGRHIVSRQRELDLEGYAGRYTSASAQGLSVSVSRLTNPATETERIPESLPEIQPPYSVILHNDESHSMDFVVGALLKSVPSLTTEDATAIMFEAHYRGRSVVVMCSFEKAELYCDRLRSFTLGVTIERA